nr:ImmA/IrrE family metallo-endopeptidase [uncultured Mucilaginibacter sp.]
MSHLITPKIKTETLKLTKYLSDQFHQKNETDLTAICRDEGIKIIVDNYKHYFDGMLVWDGHAFNIHLNSAKGNILSSARGRFSLAHELGHYFLEAHNYLIRNGEIKPHPSNIALFHQDKIETEADYFASCLLMPKERLRNFTGGRKYSLDIVKELSESFKVSLTAALIRFAEVGTHEIMVVFCEKNTIKWFCKSKDFPMLSHNFKVGAPPPSTSVLGESFLKSDAQYTSVQSIDLEDWFFDRKGAPTSQLYEQCFYSDFYGYAISLVWFK